MHATAKRGPPLGAAHAATSPLPKPNDMRLRVPGSTSLKQQSQLELDARSCQGCSQPPHNPVVLELGVVQRQVGQG